jgi:RecA-family ATPase
LFNGSSSSVRRLDFSSLPRHAEHDRIMAALAYIPNDNVHYDEWVQMGHAIKGALGDNVPAIDLFHRWSERSGKHDAAECERLWKSIGDVKTIGAGTIFKLAADHGYPLGGEDNFGPDDLEIEHCPSKAALADGSFWAHSVHAPIAPREWVIEDWVPRKTVTMLFGAGGVGKTLLAQQIGNCVAAGETLFGVKTQQMPVISVSCEDDGDELSRRQLDINQWMGVNEFGSGPDNLLLWPRVGHDNILVTFPGQGEDQPGQFFEILCNKIEAVKGDAEHVLVILDTAADLFGGNEIVRREVNTFIKTYLGGIVQKYNATVILLAHPSLAGMASKSGLSGSTAWENSVRSRSYLHSDDDDNSIRTLSRMKSNYSGIGADSDIKLIWDEGVLCMPTTPEHFDKINNVSLKRDVMEQVDVAWYSKNPLRERGARRWETALAATLPQHKKGAVVKAFKDLVGSGNIVHEERKGYKTEIAL